MQTITISNFAAAMNLTKERSGFMLTGVPYHITGARAERRYSFPAALPRITRQKYRDRVPVLLSLARDDGELYVGSDLALGEALGAWIDLVPEAKERLARVRSTFFSALASSTRSSGWHDEVERIRTLLPLSQHVLPYLLTGSKEGLPDWGAFSRAFALVHASPYDREVAA